MAKNYLSPQEITDYTIDGGVAKVNRKVLEVFLMAVMAGVYIALAGLASSTAAHAVANKGLAKLITGVVFPVGLMLVLINGSDLFTGNCLIVMSVMDKKTKVIAFIKNLVIVLAGNFVGAVAIAYLEAGTGIFSMSDNAFGGYVIKTAVAKVNLSFQEAFFLGILCNIFVCAGVWMMYAAKDTSGKVLAGFFPILAFAISGSEHIVANMYYIPAALFVKSNPAFIEASHASIDQLSQLTWSGFLMNNAIPVILGNIIGGVFIGAMYYVIYKKLNKASH